MAIVAISCNQTPSSWTQFRGNGALGIADNESIPLEWNIESGENIRWQIPIEGLGHACPVVWNDKLFLTTAVSASGKSELKVGLYGDIDSDNDVSVHEFRTICIDAKTGEILWNQLSAKKVPSTKRHTKATHANCTPATNGEYVVAFFGSEGLYCYDMNGELKWTKDFGRMNAGPYTDPDTEWGFANSPIIENNQVVVQCDFLGDSFITLLDIKTGEEIWRTTRDEISTWSTPTVVTTPNRKQIVVNGYKTIGGYDYNTGEELWKIEESGGDAPVPTPLYTNGLIYIHNSHGRKSPIYAIDPDAVGNITLDKDSTSNAYIKWSIKRGAAYMPTNMVYNGLVYNLRMNGHLTVYEANTGEKIYSNTIPDARGITASGVASNGKLYYCTEQGTVYVIKAGKEFEILAKNQLDEVIMATPAIANNTLYIRTQNSLVAVGE